MKKWRIESYILGGWVLRSPNGKIVKESDWPYPYRYDSIQDAYSDVLVLFDDPYYCK